MLLRSAGGHAPWHSNVRSKYDFLPAALAAEVRLDSLTLHVRAQPRSVRHLTDMVENNVRLFRLGA